MFVHMLFPVGLVGTLFATLCTLVLLVAQMALFVELEVSCVGECLIADVARVCLFGLVDFGMHFQAHKVVK